MPRLVASIIPLILLAAPIQAAIIRVPNDYPTIQAAIDASSGGDTIIVEPGRYKEQIDFVGKAITVRSEMGPSLTTIDGKRMGCVVTFASGETEASVLRGFTVTNGRDIDSGGGAIFCSSSSPTIINNTISGNSTYAGGGGICCCSSSSSPIIAGNTIAANRTGYYEGEGGGIYCDSSSATIKNNTISENSADSSGGGIGCYSSSPAIIDNIITKNVASNSGFGRGGGISCSSSSPAIMGATIAGNGADGGGGVHCVDSFVSIANTILRHNLASKGEEMWIGLYDHPSTATIGWSDVDGGQSSCFVAAGSTLVWGPGMIDADPLFVDAAGGDLHLTWQSPCRDAGDNSAVAGLEDFEGDPRIAKNTVDMGADEFYYHLYHAGNVVPGGTLEIKVVGGPNMAPVWLALGSGVLDPPVPTPYGDYYLAWPLQTVDNLGSIPSSGVLVLGGTVPGSWSPGDAKPFQALVGALGGPMTRLTNPMVLEVE